MAFAFPHPGRRIIVAMVDDARQGMIVDPFGDAMLEEVMLLAAMTRLDETRPEAADAAPGAVTGRAPATAAPADAAVPVRRRVRGGRIRAWLGGGRTMPGGEPEHPYGS